VGPFLSTLKGREGFLTGSARCVCPTQEPEKEAEMKTDDRGRSVRRFQDFQF
jgi:hypothetical protein